MTDRRHLRAIPTEPQGPEDPATVSPWASRGPIRTIPAVATVAVLKARPSADAEGLVLALVLRVRATGGRPALLWCERTEGLAEGVVSVATAPALFPVALQDAASAATVARCAHVGDGPGAEASAAAALLADLGEATHAVLDGRLLGVIRAHLGVLVTGDEIGPESPVATALRGRCDVEVYAPSEAIATALVLALDRRA